MRRRKNIHTFKAYKNVDIPAFHFYAYENIFCQNRHENDMCVSNVALSNLGKRTCCD